MKFKLFNRNKNKRAHKKVFKKIGIVFILFAIFFVVSTLLEDKNCSIAGIKVHGGISTYIPENSESDSYYDDVTTSEDVVSLIEGANKDEDIKAIIMEIDSNGGFPVAAEEISNAVKNSKKPIWGFIRESGVSAAYYGVSSADKIWASKHSDIGGIGVTISYLNEVELNKKKGYTYEQLSAGKFKDTGSVDKALTKEEKDLLMRDINIIHQNFIKDVSINRNIPIEKVIEIADGSTVLGEKAKELGLIDEIGGLSDIKKYFEGTFDKKPVICWE